MPLGNLLGHWINSLGNDGDRIIIISWFSVLGTSHTFPHSIVITTL